MKPPQFGRVQPSRPGALDCNLVGFDIYSRNSTTKYTSAAPSSRRNGTVLVIVLGN
jgi:hypothetical protein